MWSYDEFLALSNPQEEGRLGSAVAVASRTAVVGAPSYYHSQNDDPGSMYIGVKGNVGWGGKFSATGDAVNDFFGTSVAIDGGTAIVGAPGVAVGSDIYVGKAYVFTRDSSNQDTGSWSQETILDAGSNAGQGAVFGASVAVDGNTIVVGANGEDTYTGAAYVFTKSNNVWSRVARLTAPNRQISDAFGGSVAIDGDTIVVGAQGWDGGAQDSPRYGAAFVFTKNNNVWSRVARLTASDYADTSDVAEQDQFGFAVAVEGDTIVVGNHLDDDDGDDSGSVYLFTKPSGGWTTANETVQLTAPGAAADDAFGFSVAARGGRFIVGAPGAASSKGAAYVYSIPEWTDITVPASDSGTMSYTVTGLDNGVEYTLWVLPVVGSDHGPISDSVTATPTAAKAAKPANLTALGIDREVTLSWDDPNDSSITRFRYRQKEGDGTFGSWNDIELTDIDSTSDPGKLKYTVSDLTNGTTYTFQIFAKDNHEDSETSDEVSASPAAPPPLPLVPPFVSNIGQDTATDDIDNADLSNGQAQGFRTGKDATGYVLGSIDVHVHRAPVSENLTVSVRSLNDEAEPGDAVHTLTNPDTIEPGLVRFTAPDDAQLAADTFYFVHLTFSGTGTIPLLRTTASDDLDSGTAYEWEMDDFRYYLVAGNTRWFTGANALKISINEVLDPPVAPANLEAAVGDGQVVLTWDDPQDAYITKYQYSSDGGANYTDIALTDIDSSETGKFKYTIENLSNGTTYTFAVRAVNSAGDGATDTRSAVMMPTAPTGFTATPLDAKVELSWDDPDNATITKYQLLHHAQRATLTAANANLDDELGNSVAVAGDTAVVGMPGDDDTNENSGAVVLFTRDSGGGWSQAAKLKASDAADGDEFGTSVAFDGDTIVVGAPFDDDNGDDSGSAYVFAKSNGDWGNAPPSGDHKVETAKLTPSDGAEYNEFGWNAVAVDGDTIVVGAYAHDSYKGAVYVFTKPTGGWGAWDDLPQTGANDEEEDKDGLTAKLTAESADDGDYFGHSVAVDEDKDTIVVGASGDDGSSTEFIGSALVFVKPETGWDSSTETAKLTASTPRGPGLFWPFRSNRRRHRGGWGRRVR